MVSDGHELDLTTTKVCLPSNLSDKTEKGAMMEFSCYKKGCPYEGEGAYILSIPSEVCVDEHNRATFFCPHCNSELAKLESDHDDVNKQN